MDIYFQSDQPETCPKCGSRAELDSENNERQMLHCPNCPYEWMIDLIETFDDFKAEIGA